MLIKSKISALEAKALSRRRFLRSVSFSIALPMFPSLMPRRVEAATKAPVRFIIWWFPDGSIEDKYDPQPNGEGGLNLESTAALKWFPMSPWRGYQSRSRRSKTTW